MSWQALPKVELHLHLDVSLSYAGARELRPDLTPEAYQTTFVGPEKCADLADFLACVPPSLDLLQTERGLRVLVADVFRQLADDNLMYVEVRFAPLQHLRGGLSAHEAVRIVEAAVDQHSQATGIEARVILCTLRHYSADQSLETVGLVDAFRGSRVVGFDLAGDEAGYPLAPHLEAFAFARDRGIPVTSHAGEGAGAASVWETLEAIAPPRIGHGVRSLGDAALIERLRRDRVHLEICPTCNVQIDLFPTYSHHAIDALYREGLSLGISTDNRTITPITLNREYEKLAATFGWGAADFLNCNLNALDAAFIPASLRADLRQRLIRAYGL